MRLSAIPAMVTMIPSVLCGVGLRDLEKIKAIVRRAYPDVRQLNSETLAEWMQTSAEVLVVDVRSREELAVSHLKDAVNLRSVGEIMEAVRGRKVSETVLYCSVGFRSSRLAEILAEQGLADVMNLEGSIFQWANENRPIYRGELPVEEVHPYGKRWAGLLKAGLVKECGHLASV